MPILVRDPWRRQYFDHIPCPDNVIVPIDDMDSWSLYPAERHVYDRLYVAVSQGLPAGPHGTTPPSFPVFSKPIVNLKGMGIGSRVITSMNDYEHSYEAGHFWMQLLQGPHVSTDCAVVKGSIVWARHATGTVFRDGMFRYWTIHKERNDALLHIIEDFAALHLPHYTGLLNVETIGDKIIEMHLRFADQWCDLYGAAWMHSVVDLYHRGIWSFEDIEREGYSIPLFADENFDYDHPPIDVQNNMRSRYGISSLQITFDAGKPIREHARPPGGMRLVLINAWDLEAGLTAIDDMALNFPAERLIRPNSNSSS